MILDFGLGICAIAILLELQTLAVQSPDSLNKSGFLAFTNHLGLLYKDIMLKIFQNYWTGVAAYDRCHTSSIHSQWLAFQDDTKLHSYVVHSFSPRPSVPVSGCLSQLLYLNATTYEMAEMGSTQTHIEVSRLSPGSALAAWGRSLRHPQGRSQPVTLVDSPEI